MQISAPYDMGGRMRPKGTAAELERRRRRAMRLLESGHSLGTVARMVGTAFSAVWRWRETLRRHGPAGLAPKPPPGRPPQVTARQRPRLPPRLPRGGQAPRGPNDPVTTQPGAARIPRGIGRADHPPH